MATIVKYSTKRGFSLYQSACRDEGTRLEDVYGRYSIEKGLAFERCFDKYMNTPAGEEFSICSHNTFGFSCSWVGDYIDPETGVVEPAMFYETPKNSYIILLDR